MSRALQCLPYKEKTGAFRNSLCCACGARDHHAADSEAFNESVEENVALPPSTSQGRGARQCGRRASPGPSRARSRRDASRRVCAPPAGLGRSTTSAGRARPAACRRLLAPRPPAAGAPPLDQARVFLADVAAGHRAALAFERAAPARGRAHGLGRRRRPAPTTVGGGSSRGRACSRSIAASRSAWRIASSSGPPTSAQPPGKIS